MSPDTKRLFLGFLLLTADIRNDISNHLRPVLKGLACSGNGLIGCCHHLIRLKFLPRRKHRRVRLNGAVRLNSHETALCAKTLLLVFNYLHMLRVDLRNHHRHIRCPTVRAVIGNDRSFCLRILLLNLLNLFLCHVHCGKYEIDLCRNLLHFVDIHNHNLFHCFRHRCVHLPAVSDCLLISLAGTSRARCDRCHFKPRMILQQRNKSLTNHTCTTQNTNSQLFTHDSSNLLIFFL